MLRIRDCHTAERQLVVDDDKTTVKKLGFDAVAVIVTEPRVLDLDPSQIRLDDQTVTCIAVKQLPHKVHTTQRN